MTDKTPEIAVFEKLLKSCEAVAGVIAVVGGKMIEVSSQAGGANLYSIRLADLTPADVVRGISAFNGVDILSGSKSVGAVPVAETPKPKTYVDYVKDAAATANTQAVIDVLVKYGFDREWLDAGFEFKKPHFVKLANAADADTVAGIVKGAVGQAECMDSVKPDLAPVPGGGNSAPVGTFTVTDAVIANLKVAKSTDDAGKILLDAGCPRDPEILKKYLCEARDKNLCDALKGKVDAIIVRRIGALLK